MKHRDKILQPKLRLSAHIMKGKLKILGANPKSGETTLLAHTFGDFQTLRLCYAKLPCFGYDTLQTLSCLSTHEIKEKLKILGKKHKF